MLLRDFSGGWNTRIASHLIAPNEGQIYENIDNESGILKPLKDYRNTSSTMDTWFTYFYANDEWVSKALETYYVEYRERLYYTSGGNAYKYDGLHTHLLGIDDPEDKLVLTTRTINGNLDGTYSYVYTYYNKNEGVESSSSPLSDDITVSNQPIDVKGIIASTSTQVTHIRLYRIGGTLSSYSLVEELDNASVSVYADNSEDYDIAGNHVLDSTAHTPPPEGLDYLIKAYAMLFGVVNDKLYYSNIAEPDAWPVTNFLDFDAEITGIGALQTGLIVFTKFQAWVVTGNSPTTFSKYLLSGEQGCISHASIQFVDNQLLWASLDGICSTNGGKVNVLTQGKLGKLSLTGIHNAQVFDRVYYLSCDKGTLAMDFRYNKILRRISTKLDLLGYYKDSLYAIKDGTLVEMFKGEDNLPAWWKSPVFVGPAYSENKTYKELYVTYIGDITFKVYKDDTLMNTYDLSSTKVTSDNLKIKGPNNGYSIWFETYGTGEILEIEFTEKLREK